MTSKNTLPVLYLTLIILFFLNFRAAAQSEINFANMSDSQKLSYRLKFINYFKRLSMNTTLEDAKFLRIIVECSHVKRGIEVGSANGFGAIHLGMGFEHNGGQLITIDINPRMVRDCRKNVKKMGLEKTVTCVKGDALKVLPKLEGKFDFIFLDAHKPDYYKYFKAIEDKLTKGAVSVADNVIRGAALMKDFLDTMENNPDYDMVSFRASDEKKDGMAVIYKIK